jgi:hypothetical protein
MARLLDIDPQRFSTSFDTTPFRVGHELAGHPLFSLARLVELARDLPEELVEYNAGDVPTSLDPARTPRTGLSVQETIRRIDDCRSWMVLKNVERDPEYRALLDRCLDEVQERSEPLARDMRGRVGFIFITSPSSVTPCHLDPECNFLLHMRGTKAIHIFDGGDRELLPERELERFFTGGHRNVVLREEHEPRAFVFELLPGDGVHVPWAFPHYVRNGPEVSISFSITFQTPATERRALAYKVNSHLRRFGLAPKSVGRSGWRDAAKARGFDAARALARLLRSARPQTTA